MLASWQRLGIVAFFAAVAIFGGLVELRSAFLKRRMTDLGVYLRAAWAVRAGEDIYTITDDNGWHYHYPPLLAIVLVPLADPPAGVDRSGMLPFSASVIIWYIFSILCLLWGTHRLARSLESAALGAPRNNERWWRLRALPMLVCLSAIGAALMRGQVSMLLLALLCAAIAAALEGRRRTAGLWLAGAICLKVIPAFLLIYPLWRRDTRMLWGCALGLIVMLGLIPALVFGPKRTAAYYVEWTQVLLRPGITAAEDPARADELLKVTRTDSQSFLSTIHNTLNLERKHRPSYASTEVRLAHWFLGGLVTLATLLAAGWRKKDAIAEASFWGMLIVLMILISPVNHLHYFCLELPLVMAIAAARWRESSWNRLGIATWGLLVVVALADILAHIPGLELIRDLGVVLYASLALWIGGIVILRRAGSAIDHAEPDLRRLAA